MVGSEIVRIWVHVLPYECLSHCLIFLAIINRKIPATFCMLYAYDIATIQVIVNLSRLCCMLVVHYSPFLVILTHIGFVPFEKILGITPPERRAGSEITLKAVLRYDILK